MGGGRNSRLLRQSGYVLHHGSPGQLGQGRQNKDRRMTSVREQAGIRWRRYRPRQRLFHNPLALMPLVHLALLLMLFMLLHASFVRQPSSAVQLPTAAFLTGTPYGLMLVTLTQ